MTRGSGKSEQGESDMTAATADAMGGGESQETLPSEIQALAETWPRALIAEGWSDGLAEWWILSRARSVAMGGPPFAAAEFSPAIGQALFEIRRARRLVRGLEGAETALAAQQIGLSQAVASQTQSGKPRVSRLLIVSQDGSPRFYHQVEKLQERFAQRLQVLRIECDEAALGYAIFGGAQRARAVLLDHKEAVLLLFGALIADLSEDETPETDSSVPSDPSAPQASANSDPLDSV